MKEIDSSWGNVRRRVTAEIEIDGADDPTSRATIKTMMQAAIDRYEVRRPHASSVRLWRPYGEEFWALNRIVYAPDGCVWAGTDCTGESWTDLLKGEIPFR